MEGKIKTRIHPPEKMKHLATNPVKHVAENLYAKYYNILIGETKDLIVEETYCFHRMEVSVLPPN